MSICTRAGVVRMGGGCKGWMLAVVSLVVVGREVAAESPAGEVEMLRRQVGWLCESLAGAKAEIDALKARLDRNEFEVAWGVAEVSERGSMPQGLECSVVEVNEELGMAVVNAGRRQGLRLGMRLAAMRAGKVVARLRIVDVRPMIAGVVIERMGREFPGARDRVVLAPGSKE